MEEEELSSLPMMTVVARGGRGRWRTHFQSPSAAVDRPTERPIPLLARPILNYFSPPPPPPLRCPPAGFECCMDGGGGAPTTKKNRLRRTHRRNDDGGDDDDVQKSQVWVHAFVRA